MIDDPAPDLFTDLCPIDPLMVWPWLAHLRYCLGTPDIVAAFREATGHAWTPGRTPLERLVDETTGAGAAFLRAFAAWTNREFWGEEEGRAGNGGLTR